jgi:hypothetical protein
MTVVEEVQMLLADAGVFWPVAQLYDAINAAQLDLLVDAAFATEIADLALTPGGDLVALPSTIYVPTSIENDNELWLPVTHGDLEAHCREWRSAQPAEPRAFVLWDAYHLRVWPSPNGSYTFTVTGVPWPIEVDASHDASGTRLYKSAVAHAASAALLEFTRPDLADVYLAESSELLHRVKRTFGRKGHNISHIRPGTVYEKL